jgi:hypothetical protein
MCRFVVMRGSTMRACFGCRRTAVASGAALAMLVAMPSAKAILQSLTATGALTAIEPGSLVENRAWPADRRPVPCRGGL